MASPAGLLLRRLSPAAAGGGVQASLSGVAVHGVGALDDPALRTAPGESPVAQEGAERA